MSDAPETDEGPASESPGAEESGPGESAAEESAAEESGESRTGDAFVDSLLVDFHTARWESSHGQDVIEIDREELLAFAESAKSAGFEMCVDVTAVDWFKSRDPRFEVLIGLLSIQHRRRIRLRVPVDRLDPIVPSVVSIWPGANYAEREVYDMFGIRFDGHPDLTRILMPDEWEGHPLRKDYGVGAVPVQFKGANKIT